VFLLGQFRRRDLLPAKEETIEEFFKAVEKLNIEQLSDFMNVILGYFALFHAVRSAYEPLLRPCGFTLAYSPF
jgi:hypothetical protein